MAQQDRATLKAFIDANINTNGNNAITGAQMNTILNNLVDSCLNLSDDSTSLANDIYRAATVAVTAGVVENVAFSSAVSTANYQVVMADPEGVGFENITNKTVNGFDFTPLGTGNITYLIMINN